MHRVVLLAFDLFLILISTVFALFLRENFEFSAERFEQFLPYLLLTVITATPVLLVFGLNRALWRFSSLPDYVRIVLAVAVTVLLAVALGFVANRMEGVARSLPILQGLLMVCALVSMRVFMRLRHASLDLGPRAALAVSQRQELVLVVGLNAVTDLFLRSVDEFAVEQVKVVGLLGRGDRHRGRRLRLYPVLGTAEELEWVLADLEVHGLLIDRIVITTRFEQLSPAAQGALLHVERTSNIQLDFFAERVVLNNGRSETSDPQGPPGRDREPAVALARLNLDALGSRPYFRWKRVFDVTAATVAGVCLAPVAVLVGLVITCAAGPPPIFWQQRPGANGRPFKLYKFRTMAAAHDRHGRRLADAERLSMIGRLVRRVRLDELPQLYNILIGEMSFVGPRPLLPADQSRAFAARLAVRPGLTGWAQIKGGRELTASDKAVLDIWYVRNASFWLDLKIILGTLRMIVLGERTDRKAIRQACQELGIDTLGQKRPAAAENPAADNAKAAMRTNSKGKYETVMRLTVPQAPSSPSPARSRA